MDWKREVLLQLSFNITLLPAFLVVFRWENDENQVKQKKKDDTCFLTFLRQEKINSKDTGNMNNKGLENNSQNTRLKKKG